MKKKVLVLLVTLSMTIGNVLPVYAMDETEVKQAQETNEFETTDYEAQESFDIETEAVTTIDATEYAENKQCQELADRLGQPGKNGSHMMVTAISKMVFLWNLKMYPKQL